MNNEAPQRRRSQRVTAMKARRRIMEIRRRQNDPQIDDEDRDADPAESGETAQRRTESVREREARSDSDPDCDSTSSPDAAATSPSDTERPCDYGRRPRFRRRGAAPAGKVSPRPGNGGPLAIQGGRYGGPAEDGADDLDTTRPHPEGEEGGGCADDGADNEGEGKGEGEGEGGDDRKREGKGERKHGAERQRRESFATDVDPSDHLRGDADANAASCISRGSSDTGGLCGAMPPGWHLADPPLALAYTRRGLSPPVPVYKLEAYHDGGVAVEMTDLEEPSHLSLLHRPDGRTTWAEVNRRIDPDYVEGDDILRRSGWEGWSGVDPSTGNTLLPLSACPTFSDAMEVLARIMERSRRMGGGVVVRRSDEGAAYGPTEDGGRESAHMGRDSYVDAGSIAADPQEASRAIDSSGCEDGPGGIARRTRTSRRKRKRAVESKIISQGWSERCVPGEDGGEIGGSEGSGPMSGRPRYQLDIQHTQSHERWADEQRKAREARDYRPAGASVEVKKEGSEVARARGLLAIGRTAVGTEDPEGRRRCEGKRKRFSGEGGVVGCVEMAVGRKRRAAEGDRERASGRKGESDAGGLGCRGRGCERRGGDPQRGGREGRNRDDDGAETEADRERVGARAKVRVKVEALEGGDVDGHDKGSRRSTDEKTPKCRTGVPAICPSRGQRYEVRFETNGLRQRAESAPVVVTPGRRGDTSGQSKGKGGGKGKGKGKGNEYGADSREHQILSPISTAGSPYELFCEWFEANRKKHKRQCSARAMWDTLREEKDPRKSLDRDWECYKHWDYRFNELVAARTAYRTVTVDRETGEVVRTFEPRIPGIKYDVTTNDIAKRMAPESTGRVVHPGSVQSSAWTQELLSRWLERRDRGSANGGGDGGGPPKSAATCRLAGRKEVKPAADAAASASAAATELDTLRLVGIDRKRVDPRKARYLCRWEHPREGREVAKRTWHGYTILCANSVDYAAKVAAFERVSAVRAVEFRDKFLASVAEREGASPEQMLRLIRLIDRWMASHDLAVPPASVVLADGTRVDRTGYALPDGRRFGRWGVEDGASEDDIVFAEMASALGFHQVAAVARGDGGGGSGCGGGDFEAEGESGGSDRVGETRGETDAPTDGATSAPLAPGREVHSTLEPRELGDGAPFSPSPSSPPSLPPPPPPSLGQGPTPEPEPKPEPSVVRERIGPHLGDAQLATSAPPDSGSRVGCGCASERTGGRHDGGDTEVAPGEDSDVHPPLSLPERSGSEAIKATSRNGGDAALGGGVDAYADAREKVASPVDGQLRRGRRESAEKHFSRWQKAARMAIPVETEDEVVLRREKRAAKKSREQTHDMCMRGLRSVRGAGQGGPGRVTAGGRVRRGGAMNDSERAEHGSSAGSIASRRKRK